MTRSAVRPVAAVVTDDLDAVPTVRQAVRLAAVAHRPLLLLVPLPGRGPSIDPVLHQVAHRRRNRDAEAILGRLAPVLTRYRGPVSARVVTYRPGHIRNAGLAAVLRVAARADAEVLAVAARWAGRSMSRGVVLLAPTTGLPASGQLESARHGVDESGAGHGAHLLAGTWAR